ncbi:PKD domain-containing protein [Halorarius halobius]|uniref:PKD domain-containing protein n=1 Tax=Halorarius halobius TaxID=2962671 RepID=UPI0020CF63CB|nr:PKD domain-containing protein [Halorarius halobius]
MRTRALTLTALVVLAAVVPFVGGVAASSHEGEISLNDTEVTLSEGESVVLAVRYDTAPGTQGPEISGIQFELGFNESVLNATNPQQGTYLTKDGGAAFIASASTDNSTGVVDYGEARQEQTGVTGAGDVAYVEFIATEDTSKPLGALTSVTFETVKISDPNQNSVPTRAVNATIDTVDPTPPTAVATANLSTANVSEVVGFDASDSTDNHRIDSYEWDLDDDGQYEVSGNDPTAATAYDSTGTRTVTLRVTDADGNSATDTATVEIIDGQPPSAAVSPSSSSVELGDAVTLDGSASTDNAGIASYEWDFDGDGQVDTTTQSPSVEHTYGETGSYNASLTVVDASGNADTAYAEVTVSDTTPPSVAVQANTTEQTLDAPVAFNASGTTDNGAVAYYEWDFDEDGQVDANTTSATVMHTFGARGTYNVTVTATDRAGNSGSATAATVSIVDGTAPVADVAAPDALNVSEAGTFNGSASSDNTEIASYAWTFGDGANATGATVDHTYDARGEYEVALTVTDVDGNTDTATATVSVVDEVPPSASASANRTSAELNVSVVGFDARQSTDNDAVAEYRWDFDGDGTVERTTTDGTTAYVYPSMGTFTPAVTVVDASGNADTATTANVTVADTIAPDPALTGPTPAVVNVTSTFDASGTTDNGDVVEYQWDFDGDGTTNATTSTPTADTVYTVPGRTLTVSVTAVDAAGNTATETLTVNTTRAPGVSVLEPVEGAYRSTDSPLVTYEIANRNAGDVDHAEYRVDDGAWQVAAGSDTEDSGTVTLEGLADGSHTVEFRLVDGDGGTLPFASATTNRTFIVDTVAPTVELVGPEQGRVMYGTNLTFAYEDASDVTATFARNTSGDATAGAEDTVVATDGWPEGPTSVTVTATDAAGNQANRTFAFDFVSPPDVDSVEPTNGTLLGDSTPTVRVTYSDDDVAGDSGVDPASVSLAANGQPVSLENASVTPTALEVTLPELAVSDTNEQTLVVGVADNASHATEASWTFTVDNRAPRIELAGDHTDRVSTNYPVALSVDVTETHPNASTALVRNASTGATVATLSDAPADGSALLTWNATDDTGDAVPSGSYEVVVESTDSVGNAATETLNVSVDNTPPTVTVTDVSGPNTVGGTVVTNGTASFAATADGTPGEAANVTFVLSAQSQNFEVPVPATLDNGTWTATADLTSLPDDGTFDVRAVATDPARNTDTASAGTPVKLDRVAPALGVTVTRVDDTTARVNLSVTNGDTLDGDSIAVQLRTPNGSTSSLAVSQASPTRYTGTFEVNQSGLYSGLATATDEAGNRGTDSFGSVLETVSTENKTVTVFVERSGSFVRFNTTAEVNNTFVTITDSATPLQPLAADLRGARFIDGQLGTALSQNLSNATIGLPVNESALPSGVTPSAVSIRYYNPSTDSWELEDTRIAEVTLANGVTDEYYLTTVDHFSTYGATVRDETAPTLTASSPADGTEYAAATDEVTARFEYEDNLTGVDASAVSVSFDGTDVTDDADTQVTSDYATFTATGLSPGTSHTVSVTVVDNAGNSETFDLSFTVTNDNSPPTVTLDPSDGASLSTSSPTLSATYSDAASSIDTSSVEVTLDGQTVTSGATVTASEVTYDASGLSDGSHTFSVTVADTVGQSTTETASFTVSTGDGGSPSGPPSSSGPTSPSDDGGTAGGAAGTAGSPDISQTSADVSTTSLAVGETVTVSATLENDGDAPGDATVSLSVDGDSVGESRTVRVPANGTATAVFGYSFDEPGTYTLAVGNQTAGTVTVNEAATPETPADTPTPTATPADTGGDETATPSATRSATPTRSGTPTADGGPGFTAVLALVAVLAGALLALRRD